MADEILSPGHSRVRDVWQNDLCNATVTWKSSVLKEFTL